MHEITGGSRRRQRVLPLILMLLAGCAPVVPGAAAAPSRQVVTGLDVLLRDGPPPALAGKRLGLLTNHTGISTRPAPGRNGRRPINIDLMRADTRLNLVALFSPEHSITGEVLAGVRVDSGRDDVSGLPIHSLYGATRVPTPEMLRGIDVLVFDIQDIGTRYYTYVWTMAEAMKAAARDHKEFAVLDRPNPIGGDIVQGNVLDPAFSTLVGLYPVPMRHGMTPGEIARFVNTEHGINAKLTVIPMEGWKRSTWFEQTGLPWLAPSPNMPSVESALHYPGTCLFEGVNLSVGRGTPLAFQQVGAPWLNAGAIAARLNERMIPGVRFEATTFTSRTPGDAKYDGVQVNGLRFVATDRAVYDPTRAAVAVLVEIRKLHGDSLRFTNSHFDRLAGTNHVREMIVAGETVERITATWPAQRANFETARRRYLLYP